MILDERTEFADAASVAAGAGTALIGDQIDLQALGGALAGLGSAGDIGNGQPVYLVITVATGIVAAGAGTISFILASDAGASIATNGSATEHLTVGPFVTQASTPAAGLDVGDVLACVALPLEGQVYERYLGILCTIATQTVSAGAINAFLTLDPTGWRAFPEGDN